MATLVKYINNRIDEDFSSVVFSSKNFKRIEYLLNNPPQKRQFKQFIDSMVKIVIKDGEVSAEYIQNDMYGRKNEILNLFKKSVAYLISKGKNVPDTILYFGTKDSHNYYEPELPILVLAKPEKEPGILFPDGTFENWEKDREDLLISCKDVSKENKLFFRGVNNGYKDHNLRKLLSNDRKFKVPNKIIISDIKVPQNTFCKYKYLLNLPGGAPWSYRFKYLFLMKSLVINVSLKVKYEEVNAFQKKWIQFFDPYFIPGEDYIEIDYKWGKEFPRQKQSKNYDILRDKLEKTFKYYETHEDEYKEIVKSGYSKIKKIDEKIVYDSIYKIIKKYSKESNNMK